MLKVMAPGGPEEKEKRRRRIHFSEIYFYSLCAALCPEHNVVMSTVIIVTSHALSTSLDHDVVRNGIKLLFLVE